MKRCDHVSVRARITFRSELISSLHVSSVKPLKYPSHFRVYNLNEEESDLCAVRLPEDLQCLGEHRWLSDDVRPVS